MKNRPRSKGIGWLDGISHPIACSPNAVCIRLPVWFKGHAIEGTDGFRPAKGIRATRVSKWRLDVGTRYPPLLAMIGIVVPSEMSILDEVSAPQPGANA